LQLGVGIKGGAQSVGHALQAAIAHDPDIVVVQLDFANAFNEIRRTDMLEAVSTHAPRLLPFASWAYSSPSQLLLRDAPPGMQPIMSSAGVRQGDPLGPLLFALTMQGPLRTVNAAFPEAAEVAYLDDTFVLGRGGETGELVPAVRAFLQSAGPVGLRAKLPKCSVYSRSVESAAQVAAELGMRHCEDGLVATGTPIGTPEFVAAHAQTKADQACSMVETLMHLPLQSQDQLLLLRRSLQKKLAHLPRCVEYPAIEGPVTQLEDRVEDAVLSLMGCRKDTVSDECRQQLALPLRHGGFGLERFQDNELKALAAFVAGAAVAQVALKGAPPHMLPF
jgi:hypothetical protein